LSLLKNFLTPFGYDLPLDDLLSLDWVKKQVDHKIERLDGARVREDVNALLRERDQGTLKLWNGEYFHNLVKQWT
jgi:hypothetical protein